MMAAASPIRSWHWRGSALLLDLDGTLVDSTASVLRAWQGAADELGLPFAQFEDYVHGIPADPAFASRARRGRRRHRARGRATADPPGRGQ